MQSSIGKVSGNYLQEKIVSSDGKIIIEVQDVFSTIFFSMSRTLGMIYWTWGDKFSVRPTAETVEECAVQAESVWLMIPPLPYNDFIAF